MTISRRQFAKLITVGAAAAVGRPAISFAKTAVAATPAYPAASGPVRLSSNENPYGPSPKAFKAMNEAFDRVCRYPDKQVDVLIESLAKLNRSSPGQVLLGDGSSEILKLAAETFTGRRGRLVAADPTFEAILEYAAAGGAEVVKVPLTSSFSHDLPKMAAAGQGGLIYICNPNNPTASITPKNELRDFIAALDHQTTVLIDEAYYDYADSPEYESMLPLVESQPNLIVSRTFSKIYGLAGLRCGYCVAQKQIIDRLRKYQPWDSVNIMALIAASANLADADQVPNGRRLNKECKEFTVTELEKMGYRTIPSEANFIMTDVRRPVVPLIQAMGKNGVQVGRLFPAMPNHMRVTIGRKNEMEAFLKAFREVIV